MSRLSTLGAMLSSSSPRNYLLSTAIILASLCASSTTADQAPSSPTVFAPHIISGIVNNASPAFSPDCRFVYFTRSNDADNVILVSHLKNGEWSAPTVAPFSGTWRDLEPAMSPDGSRLVFASNRPAQSDGKPLDGEWGGKAHPASGGNLWYVDRHGSAWSDPVRLSDAINSSTNIFSPSIAADGTLYFMKVTPESGRWHLFRSRLQHGEYQPAERLSFSTTEQWSDVDPAVAPDQSFVVFSSGRPPAVPGDHLDLFIAFQKDGNWSEPQPLDPLINGASGGIEARLAPDRYTLYFTSRRTLPITFPKTPAVSAESLKQMSIWNNGLGTIWRVDLSPSLPNLGTTHTCTPQ